LVASFPRRTSFGTELEYPERRDGTNRVTRKEDNVSEATGVVELTGLIKNEGYEASGWSGNLLESDYAEPGCLQKRKGEHMSI
jgi:hypothetical protein